MATRAAFIAFTEAYLTGRQKGTADPEDYEGPGLPARQSIARVRRIRNLHALQLTIIAIRKARRERGRR